MGFLGQRISITFIFIFSLLFFRFRHRTESLLVKPRSYHSRAKSQCNTRSHNIDHEGTPAAAQQLHPNPTNIAKPITRGGNAR